MLDPFCGTGTTVVECKKLGIASVGIEANAMAAFASATKVLWGVDSKQLIRHAQHVAGAAMDQLREEGIEDQPLMGRAGFRRPLRGLGQLLDPQCPVAPRTLRRGFDPAPPQKRSKEHED